MAKKSDTEKCVHHWSIQAATGPQSKVPGTSKVSVSTEGVKAVGAKKAPAEGKKD